jgi:hypothetical protein
MKTYEGNFVEKCLAGLALANEIDDYVDMWHTGSHDMQLHEFLGMSWEEYALWVEQPKALGAILQSRHSHMSLKDVLEFASSTTRAAARAPSAEEAQVILDWLRSTGRIDG